MIIKRDASNVWTAKRIISIVLLLLSFLMIFLPWMSISLSVMGQTFTIPKMMDYMSAYAGYSAAEIKSELYDELVYLSDEMASEGIYMDPDQAITTLELIADSKISPFDAARICSFSSDLLGQMKKYLARNSQDFYGEEGIAVSMIMDAADKVTFAAVLMWVFVIGCILAFAFSLYFLTKGKKYGVVPYLCFSIVLLIVFIVMTSKVNSGIKLIMNTFSYGASSILDYFDISFSPSMDLSILHLGKSGILCVVFAVGALVLTMLREDTFTHLPIPSTARTNKWRCPSCGSEMPASALFCTSCGTKRSEGLRCVSCGHALEKGVVFCPYCGTPAVNRAASSAKAGGKRCHSCGCTTSVDSTVCPSCGHSFAGSPKLWGTLAKPNDNDLS